MPTSPIFRFGDHLVGPGHPVFLIAEIGINHDGDFDRCKDLICQAKEAGAHAVKLQTYITEERVPKDSPIFDILKKCELSFEQQERLFEYARSLGVEAFSTPFDATSVDFLRSAGVPGYKIASFDLVNKKLLREIVEAGSPVILSCGMASRGEIDAAVDILNAGGLPFALLHCVSAYPVPSPKDLNLRTIGALEKAYKCVVGFSDHSEGVESSVLAVAAGAHIIERHFTYSRSAEGPDHALSLDPAMFRLMANRIGEVSEALGEEVWGSIPAEADILPYRRPTD